MPCSPTSGGTRRRRRCRPRWRPGSTRPSPGWWPSAQEPRAARRPANVVPLRRRWATRAAAAAAAVIVVGAGGVAAANLGVFGGSRHQSTSAGGGAAAAAGASRGALRQRADRTPRHLQRSSWPGRPAPTLTARPRSTPTVDSPGGASAHALAGRDAPTERKADGATRPAEHAAAGGCPGPTGQRRRHDHLRCCTTAARPPSSSTPSEEGSASSRRGPAAATACSTAPRSRVGAPGTSGQSSPGDPGLGSPSPSP